MYNFIIIPTLIIEAISIFLKLSQILLPLNLIMHYFFIFLSFPMYSVII